jgi:hypothetical protein
MLQLDPGADGGRARLDSAGDRGDGGLLGQGERPRGGQHRYLPAAEGRGGIGLGHRVPEGCLKAWLQRHRPTLRRPATARWAVHKPSRWLLLVVALEDSNLRLHPCLRSPAKCRASSHLPRPGTS